MKVRRVGLVALLALAACASLASRPGRARYEVAVMPLADNALDFLYFAIAERGRLEAWFCLRGFIDHRTKSAVVTGLAPLFVDSAAEANITGRPAECVRGGDSASIIGTVHFHPDPGQCEFSDVDLITAHYLPYAMEAIMCRDGSDPRPQLRTVFRREIDSAYTEIQRRLQDHAGPTRTYKAIYRYVTPPKP